MSWFRATASRFSLLLGLFAWVVVSGLSQLHELEVAHVVCAEHGEIIELHGDGEVYVASATAEVSALDADEDHEHGCLDAVSTLTASIVLPAPPPPRFAALVRTAELAVSTQTRAPPLSFAPKTGPPHTS